MKAFQFSSHQIARVIGAASADELARRFNRHIDFLTIASWSGDTKLGAGGVKLTDEQLLACAGRAAEMFGQDGAELPVGAARIADWAETIFDLVSAKLTQFHFKSAARNEKSARCSHPASHIFQDSAAAANLLHGRRRLLSFVAPHSLMGFESSVIVPNLLRIETVDCRRLSPDELSEFLLYGDVLIATPTLWRYMMRENLRSPDNTMAVSFGEPMSADLASDMRKAGFGVLREFYGSTENGLIGWRDDPNEPFILFDHWRREDDSLVRICPDGAAMAIRPMDLFEWKSDRSFRLLGRQDGAVQIGAVNVFPGDVAKVLSQHPKVSDCQVKVSKRGDGVSRLIANIVLREGEFPDERTARDIDFWCRSQLRQQERPRIFNFEREL